MNIKKFKFQKTTMSKEFVPSMLLKVFEFLYLRLYPEGVGSIWNDGDEQKELEQLEGQEVLERGTSVRGASHLNLRWIS